MPYFSCNDCKKRNVHPGMIIEGEFSPVPCTPPHLEDSKCNFSSLKFHGPATSLEFEGVLKMTVVPSIRKGFQNLIPLGQKVIPALTPPKLSIITVALKPEQIKVVDDAYNPEKIKLHIHDNDVTDYAYIAFTDLGFHHYAIGEQRDANRESRLNDFVIKQRHVYLRVGLSGRDSIGSRDGDLIQANGIYTFPDYLGKVRTYP